jgi:molybdate transport system substrate-binding protein
VRHVAPQRARCARASVRAETGHKLAIKFATSAVLKRQIEAGEAFDLALLVPGALDDLIKQGRVVAETRVDISRSPIGVAVRTGAAKPDVSSAEAFKRALASAKTIAFSGEGVSGAHFTGMLEKFGIADETKPNLRPLPGGAVADAVAKGEAEMAVITIANVLGVPGVELAGLLPAELQHRAASAPRQRMRMPPRRCSDYCSHRRPPK